MWLQPACETIGFVLGMVGMYFQEWSFSSLFLCVGLGLMPAMSFIDFHFGIIPDGLNALLGLCGFLFLLTRGDDIFFGLVSASILLGVGLFFALIYSKWRGREMLGLGDVKFFAAAGFWLHPHSLPTFLALSGILGILFNLGWRKISNEKEFPFAPALCLALALCVLYRLAGS